MEFTINGMKEQDVLPLTQIDSIDFIASILLQVHLAVFKIEQQL